MNENPERQWAARFGRRGTRGDGRDGDERKPERDGDLKVGEGRKTEKKI